MTGLRVGRALLAACVVSFTVTGVVVLWSGRFPWWGSPMAALDWTTGTNLLIGPVVAGAAAMLYSAMAAIGWDATFRGMQRGAAATLAPASVLAVAAIVSLALLFALVVVVTRVAGTDAPLRGAWIVFPTALVLVAEVLVGALVGSWVRRWWLAPIAAVAVYAVQAAGAYGSISPMLVTGPASTLLAGLTFGTPFALWQGAGAVGLALLCAATLTRGMRTGAVRTAGPTVLGLAVLVVAWVATSSLGSDARYVLATGVGWRCAGEAPTVCLSEDEVRPLDAVSREFHRQAQPLIKDGLGVPRRFVDRGAGPPTSAPADGVVDLGTVEAAAGTTADRRQVAWSLAMPAPCPAYYAVPGRAAVTVRIVVADWVMRQSHPSSLPLLDTNAEDRWLRRPTADQLRWVTPTYAALARCDLRRLSVPW